MKYWQSYVRLWCCAAMASSLLCGCGGGGGSDSPSGGSSTVDIRVSNPSVTEGDTGSGSLDFIVTLSGPSSEALSFDYATADGSATLADNDYVAAAATLVIPANTTQQTISVTIVHDTRVESDETLLLNLSNPSANARLLTTSTTGTLVNNDWPRVSIAPATLGEGDSGTSDMVFTVSMDQAAIGDVTLDYATSDLPPAPTSATVGNDYTLTSGSLVIPQGDTSARISVPVNGDIYPEADEVFQLTLSNLSGNARFATDGDLTTGTILSDDLPLLSFNAPAVVEGASGSATTAYFVLSLSETATTEVSFDYATADGDASAGSDYVALSGSATIPQGLSAVSIPVTINDDDTAEANETFQLQLSNLSGAALNPSASIGIAQIIDDDSANITPKVSVQSARVVEGVLGATANMRFTISVIPPATSDITLDYATAPGDATPGSDYDAVTGGTLTISAGETGASVNVTVRGDNNIESDETLYLQLSNLSGNAELHGPRALGRIIDDDDNNQTLPRVNIDSVDMVEGDSGSAQLLFTIGLTEAAAGDLSLDYITENISAAAGSDYIGGSGRLTIPQGELSVTLPVTVNGDNLIEADEAFRVTLSNLGGDATAGAMIGVGTIVNDDPLAIVTLNSAASAEGNSGDSNLMHFSVSLNTAAEDDVMFDYATADDTATSGTGTADDDYINTMGTVTIPAGSLSAGFDVQLIGDDVVENDELFNVTLSNPTSNAVLGAAQVSGSIVNDDLSTGWQTPRQIETDTTHKSYDPQVAMNAAGDAMVTWVDSINFQYRNYSRRFVNGAWELNTEDAGEYSGTAFQAPEISLADNDNALLVSKAQYLYANDYVAGSGWMVPWEFNNIVQNWDIQLAGNASGQAIAAWRANPDSSYANSTVWTSQYEPASGWSTPQLANSQDTTTGALLGDVAIDAAGNRFVIWTQYQSPVTTIFVRRYNAVTQLWEDPLNIDSSAVYGATTIIPDISVNAAGDAIAVWSRDEQMWSNVYHYDSNTQTGAWDATASRVGLVDNRNLSHQVALDPSGNAILVWCGYPNADFTYDIYAMRFDNQTGWPNDLGELLEQATGTARDPQVAVDDQGNALVTWVQDNDPSDGRQYTYDLRANRFSVSDDRWEGPQTIENHTESINEFSSGYSRYQSLEMNSAGDAIVVWSRRDLSIGDSSIWAARYVAP